MYNLVVSITLANQALKVSQILAFSGKARKIQNFSESCSEKVLILLDFFSIACIFELLDNI